jgi:DNA-binding Xre family transcriptional regulator
LAQRWAISRVVVAQRRRKLGIPALKAPSQGGELIAVDAAKIKALREAQGLTRFALAGKDTSLAAHLGLIESRQVKRVRAETLEKLCRLLKCRPGEIEADC